MRCLLALACLFAPSAFADEGEVSFGFVFSPEVASTSHPEAADTLPFADDATLIIKPRTQVQATYGITNSLYLGLGAGLAASTSLRTPKVTIDESTGDLLTSAYFEVTAPLILGYRFDSGAPVSGAVELELSPLATFWGTQQLVDFNDVDENGLPADLERSTADAWYIGGLARVTVLFNARIFDVVGLDIGPSVAVSWAERPALHFGLTLRPAFLWGGPL